MYNKSIVEADKLDMETKLKDEMISEFTKIKNSQNVLPCSQEDLMEFYQDGVSILQHFRKYRNKYFMKQNWELIGVEVPILKKIQTGVDMKGYLDVVLRNKISGRVVIIDLKTATRGWTDYQKKDFNKKSQLLLYKKYYSELFDVPLDKIDVMFLILKRKIAKNPDFPITRLQKFEPANGIPSINKTMKKFEDFRTGVFDDKGKYLLERTYAAKPGKVCKFCEFYDTEHCKWGKIL
jgi:predicted nucleic-acid-binding Zn-ribbon protein